VLRATSPVLKKTNL